MPFKSLSVVFPFYDENLTLESLVGYVLAADTYGLPLEVIIVAAASRDRIF